MAYQQKIRCLCATLEGSAMNRPGSCYDISNLLAKKILAATNGDIRPNIKGSRMHFHVEGHQLIIDGTIAQFLVTENESERCPPFLFCGTREELIEEIDEKLKKFEFRRTYPAVNSKVKTGEDFVRFYYDHKKIVIPGDRWYEENGRWWLTLLKPKE